MRTRPDKGQTLRVGERTVLTHGMPRTLWGDFYHRAMTISWPLFFASFAALFMTLNTMYAALYALGDKPIANAGESFEDLFYFSIETLATVGYGDMHPQTRYGHLIATLEIFTGMSIIAVMTGLVFARFSRPRAMILFVKRAVIASVNGVPTLMLRMANGRHDAVTDATAKLWMLRNEAGGDGHWARRFHELPLARSQSPVFALSWTIFHPIDAASPMFAMDAAMLAATDASFILTLSGLDEASGQTIHVRQTYSCDCVLWQHRYVDIVKAGSDGITTIDYRKFHDTHPEL